MNELLHFLLPELAITFLLFTLLLVRIAGIWEKPGAICGFMNIALPVALGLMIFMPVPEGSQFGGTVLSSRLILLEKSLLLLATWIVSLTGSPWLKGHRHPAEFYMLVLSTLLGMFFLLSSGNFLMFFLSLELASIPLAALCNFDLDKRISGESAMKMIYSSALSSGIMLFGISLLYGTCGTLSFAEIPSLLNGSSLQVMAFLMIFTGFAFKLSVVPFHFWTADVYEGAPVPVTAFLSVVSKGVMAFALVSVLYTLFHPLSYVWYSAVVTLAIVTMTVGNLMAIRQQNLKRFFAFSSMAQVGYLLIGISGSSTDGMASVLYFFLVYIFSNLAAFGVITLVSSATSRESITSWKGFYANNPVLSWVMALALFSLAGIPPTAGFFGKFFLLTAGAGKWNSVVLIMAALNMVVSLYYYLRIIRAMFMEKSDDPIMPLSPGLSVRMALIVCTAGILLLGFYSPAYEWIRTLSHGL